MHDARAGDGRPPGATATGVRRERLDVSDSPLGLLRALPAVVRLVALVGRWRAGEAVIAWDPLLMAHDPFRCDLPAGDDHPDAFGGGWIGAWGYQLGGALEALPPGPSRPVAQPLHRVGYYDRVLRRVDGVWWFEQLTGLLPPEREEGRAQSFLEVLRHERAAPPGYEVGTFAMTPTPEQHRTAVAKARDHVMAGDIYQANVTARLEADFDGDPLALFCAGVRALRPAYAAFVASPEGCIASLSPELFLRRTGRQVLSSPIKGTAALTTDPDVLAASAKDRAENVMIVDLMRNDLGRVARPGTVEVPALTRVERHAVWHLVSDVTATLAQETGDGDLLRATFPPGSVTGAPKVRAMQILQGLESTAREAYTGAIGHVSPHAGLELNVAIRTFEVAHGRVWLGVGGGIVADSDPDGEVRECFTKAGPLLAAIGASLDRSLRRDRAPAPASPTGHRVARVDRDRGVFETLLVRDRRPVELARHLGRLSGSLEEVYGRPLDPDLARRVGSHAAGLAGPHRLRIDVTPGAVPSTTLVSTPLTDPPETLELELRCVPGGLGAHKWADRRRLEQTPSAGRDLLVVDVDGHLLETGTAALFVVLDDEICAPALDGRQLPSTMRERVGEVLSRAGVRLVERPLTVGDLARATEVLAANALRGVVPVTGVVGIAAWRPGWVGEWLRDALSHAPAAPGAGPRPARRAIERPRVLFVDNYDSFVFNLVQYAQELGADTSVVRNDATSVSDLEAAVERGEITHLVLSPGPGTPAEAGISAEVVRRLGPRVPLLGVCLGHQVVASVYGGRVLRQQVVAHGKPYLLRHDGKGLYRGLPSPLVAGRYHSLVVETGSVPDDLIVTSTTASGVVMGLRHTSHPIETVQWHPESVLSRHGHAVIENFLLPGPVLDSTQRGCEAGHPSVGLPAR